MAIAVPPPRQAPRPRASRRWCSTSSPTWSSSAGSPATRSTPIAPTCSSSAPSCGSATRDATEVVAGRRRRLPRRPRDRARRRTRRATAAGPPCSPSTINRKTACLRSFYRHLRREELITEDPTATLTPADQEPQAAAGAEPGGGDEAARERHRRRPDQPARPGSARGDVRVRPARFGGDRAGDRRRRPAPRLRPPARQGLEGADRAPRPRGGACDRALPALQPARPRRHQDRAQAVRELPRRRAHPPGPLQDHPAPREGGRARRQDEPAHAAPHVRDPPAQRRLRPALGPGDARPRRRRHDPALHPPLAGEDQGGLLRAPTRGRRRRVPKPLLGFALILHTQADPPVGAHNDIGYSDRPAASRASLGSRYSRTRITLPPWNSTIQASSDSVRAPLSLPRPRR